MPPAPPTPKQPLPAVTLPDGRTVSLRPLTEAELCTCPLPCGVCAEDVTVPADLTQVVQWVAADPGCTHRDHCRCAPVALSDVLAATDDLDVRDRLVAGHVAALVDLSAHVDAAWSCLLPDGPLDVGCPACVTDPDGHAARLDAHEVDLSRELSSAISRFGLQVRVGRPVGPGGTAMLPAAARP